MRRSGPTADVVLRVASRDGYRCVRCGKPLTGTRGVDWAIHHRRGRDDLPDSHQPQNLISVCGGDNVSGCHGYIHQHGKGEPQDNGWWISRLAVAADPLTIPVLVEHGSRWVYLAADGTYADNPPEVA